MEDDSLKLKESYFNDNLGNDNRIFVGSSTDMFAENVPSEWIESVLKHLSENFPDNEYLFQSKNPQRFLDFANKFPPYTILGTTMETNQNQLLWKYSETPGICTRQHAIQELKARYGFDTQITIEPIMDFNTRKFIRIIYKTHADKVYIGADSGHNGLPEPEPQKIIDLVNTISNFTEIHLKSNLERLLIRNNN